jgi:predicted DCC family thiol-disulfide oxidoreductase YuxK
MTPQITWDDECGFCDGVVRRFRALYEARGFEFLPMRVWLASLSPEEQARMTADEMRVVLRDGTVIGGARAVAYLMRRVWWMWPAGVAGRLPIVRLVARWLYQEVARRRYQIGGSCKMHRSEPCNAKSESAASRQTAGRVR